MVTVQDVIDREKLPYAQKLERARELTSTEKKLSLDEQDELTDLIVELELGEAAAIMAAMAQLYNEGLLPIDPVY